MYVNSLISLEESMPTYRMDGKKITGHVTVTSPGVIKCYIQNLAMSAKRDFVLYAFSSKKNKGVRLGSLTCTKENRETKWRIDEESVMGSRITAADIDGVAVLKEEEGMRNRDAVLVGFLAGRYAIHNMIQDLLPKVVEPVITTTSVAEMVALDGLKAVAGISTLEAVEEIVEKLQIEEIEEAVAIENLQILEEVEEAVAIEDLQILEEVEERVTVEEPQVEEVIEEVEVTEELCAEKVLADAINNISTHNISEVLNKEFIEGHNKQKLQEILRLMGNKEDRDKSIKNSFQNVLKEKYMNKKFEGLHDITYAEESLYKGRIEEQGIIEKTDKNVREETPEEINYLEEIEKKLKDIQARLKASNPLEQNMRKIEVNNLFDIENRIEKEKVVEPQTEPVLQTQTQTEMMEEIYNSCVKISPFEGEMPPIEWVQISLDQLMAVPSLSMEWCTQPFITFSNYKYNEFILGKQKDSTIFYIGIPDLYHPERENLLSVDKEVEGFMCIKDMDPAIGEYGYWIIKI